MKSSSFQKIAFIADDDPEDIELLCEVIRDIDISINTKIFSNGKDVLTQLIACQDQELPNILILDYSMPELTGPQVLKEIAKQPRYSKISKFVLSTSSADVYIEECMLTGANAYFVKPNSMAELRSIASKILKAG